MPSIRDIVNLFRAREAEPITEQAGVLWQQQLMRMREDIATYNAALAGAEQVQHPSRLRLLEIYNQVQMDAHLTAVVTARRLKAIGKNWRLVRGEGEQVQEAEQYLRGEWFSQFLAFAFDSILWGYSLVQLKGIDAEGNVTGVSLVPRQNVRPDLGIVVPFAASTEGVDFLDDEWCVGVGQPTDLGVLSKAAPLLLYKKNALQAQAQFTELFGMPMRIGRTQAGNKQRVTDMFRMLKGMMGAGVAVIDNEEKIEFAQAGNTGVNGAVYADLIGYLDEQISKLIMGQTMTTDAGSSRSQAEVHERVGDTFATADAKLLQHAVNDHLLPRLVQLGLPLAGVRFEFFEGENTQALFEQVISLTQAGYQVAPAFIVEKFGIPVELKPQPTTLAPDEKPSQLDEDVA